YYNRNTGEGDPNCTCESACFLIWAAGLGRHGDVIGVHRTWFRDQAWFGKLSPEEAEIRYGAMVRVGKEYLREMGTPENIIQAMYATASVEMRYLSKDELNQMDNEVPFLAEQTIARCGEHPSDRNGQEIWRDCAYEIWTPFIRKGADEYLKRQ